MDSELSQPSPPTAPAGEKTPFSLKRFPRWISLGLATLGILLLGMVEFSSQKGLEMITVYAPLINADNEIKLSASIAHMWVEELLAGDQTKSQESVWKMLDRADWYATAMLNGGQNGEQKIIALEDVELRQIVKRVLQELKEFREIAEKRFQDQRTSLTGSAIDHHYDVVYSVFTQNADQLKHRLQKLLMDDLKYFKATQYTLMTVCFLILVGTGIALYRFERFREKLILALHQSNESLESEIGNRILAEDKLIDSREQLRNLNHQLQMVREEEKTRIAREVHDELGQTLTALKMELSCLGFDLKAGSTAMDGRIATMSQLIDNTIQSVQRIASELRPQILDVLGLAEAIRWETTNFENRTGIKFKLDVSPLKINVPPEVTTATFRIFQETLTNIARHSGAQNVAIRLQVDAQQIELEIMDDGRGIDRSEIYDKNSLGLLGIFERVHFLHGAFEISGSPTEGTRVYVTIPL